MGYVKVCFLTVLLLAVSNEGFAGSLNDTGAPDSGASAMYTLEDIYNRLDTGAAGEKRSGPFTEPSAGPASSGHTLDEVMGKAPTADNSNGAVAAQVLEGYTFWGLTTGAWGLLTGTMPNRGAGTTITPGTSDHTLDAGYWSSANTVSGDGDLQAGNIKSGVSIFGVSGTYPLAAVPETGQTPTVPLNPAPAGSDGALQKGVPWPNPRFTDNEDGTVTDNLTGLIWLKNANCNGTKNWSNALTWANGLHDGCSDCGGDNNDCGLSDGSEEGDWRVPNVLELVSLIDWRYYNPALSNGSGTGKWSSDDAFTSVQSSYYWSSTYAYSSDGAWFVYLYNGYVNGVYKTDTLYVWPVRAGQ